jgi:hypothetical protein
VSAGSQVPGFLFRILSTIWSLCCIRRFLELKANMKSPPQPILAAIDPIPLSGPQFATRTAQSGNPKFVGE